MRKRKPLESEIQELEGFLPPDLGPISLHAGMLFLRRLFAGIGVFSGVFLILLILLGGASLLVWLVEPRTLGESIYLVLITALTIGYGDIVPSTVIGKTAVVFAGLVGILFTGLTTALAVRALEFTLREELMERARNR